MADDTVDAGHEQRVPGLDRDQPAEPVSQHIDRPQPHCAAADENCDANPANGVAVDRPKIEPVVDRRQVGGEQPNHAEPGEDQAIAAVLSYAGAETAAG